MYQGLSRLFALKECHDVMRSTCAPTPGRGAPVPPRTTDDQAGGRCGRDSPPPVMGSEARPRKKMIYMRNGSFWGSSTGHNANICCSIHRALKVTQYGRNVADTVKVHRGGRNTHQKAECFLQFFAKVDKNLCSTIKCD